jgi:hypothetical protein
MVYAMRLMSFTCRVLILLAVLTVWHGKAAQAHEAEVDAGYKSASYDSGSHSQSDGAGIQAEKHTDVSVASASYPSGERNCNGGCCSSAACCSAAALPPSLPALHAPKAQTVFFALSASVPLELLVPRFRPPRFSA